MGWGRKPGCGGCGECDRCRRAAYMREWYASKTPDERRAMRERRDAEKVRARDRERHARKKDDPEYQARRRAVWTVNNAVRDGRLVRLPCEVCGAPAQAHHDDYAKPLEVRWLCVTHHARHHAERTRA